MNKFLFLGIVLCIATHSRASEPSFKVGLAESLQKRRKSKLPLGDTHGLKATVISCSTPISVPVHSAAQRDETFSTGSSPAGAEHLFPGQSGLGLYK